MLGFVYFALGTVSVDRQFDYFIRSTFSTAFIWSIDMMKILSVFQTPWKKNHSGLFEITFLSKYEDFLMIRIFPRNQLQRNLNSTSYINETSV